MNKVRDPDDRLTNPLIFSFLSRSKLLISTKESHQQPSHLLIHNSNLVLAAPESVRARGNLMFFLSLLLNPLDVLLYLLVHSLVLSELLKSE